MKFLRILPLFLILFIACEQKGITQETNDFIVITDKVIEYYDSILINTDYISYEYASENDYFWQKKTVKDKTGSFVSSIERELDDHGLPVMEVITDELGTTIDKAILKYDPETKQLLTRDEYEGDINDENKTITINYNYDKEGYLVSKEVIRYCDDESFKNIDGNNVEDRYTLRYLPQKESRPEGLHETIAMVESSITYITPSLKERYSDEEGEIGDMYIESKITFDENGLPLMSESSYGDDHTAKQEYFKVEQDEEGKIKTITGYMNKAMDSMAFANAKWVFTYTDDGTFKDYKEYKYNDSSKVFDMFHDAMSIEWRNPGIPLKHDFILTAETTEHFCWHSLRFSKDVEKVEKFADGEIVIAHYSYSDNADLPVRDVKPEKTKLVKMKYRVVKTLAE